MIVCKETFGVREDQHKYTIGVIHLKLADLFLDYGFYLLNVDLISHSVKLYEMALEIREHIFGLKSNEVNNLLIAMNHEELGYACYVQEYSSGNFLKADYHANKAMSIVTQLLPQNHLLLASAKRVKALILEEIAIDSHDKQEIERMLSQSEILHISALDMARQAFGEMNVQTAKHYGNLGRLYQSMKRYTEAEAMHLKAIQIKEQLLGRNDYEVALSLGHLASLYNYDMHMFEKAEELYLRSIDIGINLFGVGYSGLEYDYRGLCRVYSHLRDSDKLYHFINKLHNWKHLRDSITRSVKDSPPIKDLETIQKLSPQQIISLIENLSN
jgi:tetratricopeptide (TPR) repeat protein